MSLFSLCHVRPVDAESYTEARVGSHHPREHAVVGRRRSHAWMYGPNGAGEFNCMALVLAIALRNVCYIIRLEFCDVGCLVGPIVWRCTDHRWMFPLDLLESLLIPLGAFFLWS